MMRSEMAEFLVQRGLEQGREEAREATQRQTIMTLLQVRLGKLVREVQTRILREDRSQVLQRWYEAALHLKDESGARRLVARIRAAKPVAARRTRAR